MLQDSGEAGTQVATLKGSRAENLAKIDALASHEPEFSDESCCLEHQLFMVGFKRNVMSSGRRKHDNRHQSERWACESAKVLECAQKTNVGGYVSNAEHHLAS